MLPYPIKDNVVIEEILDPETEGDEYTTKSGLVVVPQGKNGMKRPRANLGVICAIGKEVNESIEIGDKVWYNRVDTFPFVVEKKRLQIGKAKFLLGKYERESQ